MKTGLVIPIYNRSNYVKRCFDSLCKITTIPDIIVLVDDASTETMHLSVSKPFDNKTIVINNKKNIGVKGALLKGIDKAFEKGCDLVINLDSDAIVKSDFIERLIDIWQRSGLITSGFNNPNEPSDMVNGSDCAFKRHANGINMCFNRQQYEKHIKPALLAATGNWDYIASESAGQVAITTPSCVQHIGLQSSMGHVGADVAHDFKQLTLPNVTLFGIDSHDKEGIMRAAEISCRDIEFGDRNIILDDLFTKGGNTEKRRRDYSRFMIKDLTKEFTTSHVLTIHADGYVLNWEAWQDEWLQYDYIGATWGYKDNMNVGNGGFSLRSKKLCDILAEQDIQEHYIHPEDHCICRTYRESLEKEFGIKFAPEEVANKFSIEGYGAHIFPGGNAYTGQFGFHSVHVDFSKSDLPEQVRYYPKRITQPQRQQLPMRRR